MMKSYQPDYPRPQLVRSSWQNLNGAWRFAFDDENTGTQQGFAAGVSDALSIEVPFSYETKASGIGDERVHERVWYSRTVCVEADTLAQKRVLLHFEGCDYKTTVWVNGARVGGHIGGYARFSFDITAALHAGENTLAVLAEDSLDAQQPRGKQRWMPQNFGCWYVQTTGIWKTVWMETVAPQYIKAAKLTPDLPGGKLHIACDIQADCFGETLVLEATASFGGTFVNRVTVPVTQAQVEASLTVRSTLVTEWGVHTWSPEAPNLYDLELRLLRGSEAVDTALSYFGMREVRIDGANILLNGAPLYQRLILDQGYWRDSHLTPPSEAVLIEDIDKLQQLGYNGLRKHQKTEDERFLYWCDVKGMLVWSEMASAYAFTDTAVDTFLTQWSEIVRQNYSHPCIITWTPVNESWGVPHIKTQAAQQSFTQSIYYLTKALDPHRPVIVNDGWEHTVSDIITLHDYEEQGRVFLERYEGAKDAVLNNEVYHCLTKSAFADGFGYRGQPVIISEFGGIAYNNGDSGWGYGNKVSCEAEFLARFDEITTAIQRLPYCCGFCYTQVTDVQQEINGLMDIDRNFKADPDKIREINLRQVSAFHR